MKPLQPITEDDDTIREALADAHLPSLVASIVHLTGETDLLEREQPLAYPLGSDMQGGFDEGERQTIRARALTALAAYRDGGSKVPDAPSPEIMRRLMDFITGSALPDRYAPFMLDELGIGETTTDAMVKQTAEATSDGDFSVVIIGAGMSGILAGHRLRQAGVDFTIVEKNPDVGGTWFENTYPGCRVDVSSHAYCYSFEPNHDWPDHFSEGEVLLDYFRGCAERFGVRDRIAFSTEVTEARYLQDDGRWEVKVKGPEGEQTLVANAVISAVGQLNQPRYPDIPGRETFAGPSFHSARWDHDVDLTGKRVAVIGTGASAFQFVPEIADATGELRVYQRTPPWLLPTAKYHEPVPGGVPWLMRHVPFYDRWYRFFLVFQSAEGLLPYVRVDPKWEGHPAAVSAENDIARQLITAYIQNQIPDDEALRQAAVPDYPPGGKRMLRDNGQWLSTLQRDDVRLVSEPIREITAEGIVTQDGQLHPTDVIVYGTGFHASRFLHPMRIVGRDGVALSDHWAGDARAYLGITVPGFPNLFCIYGPNTNIVVNGSIIFFSECAVRYVLGCIRMLAERGDRALECRDEVHDAFNTMVDAENARMAWGTEGVSSWYKNAKGRVSQNWPLGLVDYWERTRAPDPADFEFS